MTGLTPAVIQADPPLCPAGHRDDSATGHAALHLQAAAPVLVLTRVAAELQSILVAVVATDLALTAHIPGAHPDMREGDTLALSAALLPGKMITGSQGGLALASRATREQDVMLAGLGADSHPHQ